MAPPPEEEEEDDYMNMTFGEDAPGLAAIATSTCSRGGETSLQRRQRLKREGEERGRVKSKAELAAEAAAAREEALSRSLLEGPRARKSKGLAMMAKMGFKAGDALGAETTIATATDTGDNGNGNGNGNITTTTTTTTTEDARSREPIRLQMKEDRGGIGLDAERKRKINEAAAQQTKKVKVDENEYRERMRREREAGRLEGQFYGAMKVCERMDEEWAQEGRGKEGGGSGGGGEGADDVKIILEEEEEKSSGDEKGKKKRIKKNKKEKKKKALSTRQLKSIPVEWRGLVRKRQEAERDAHKIRYDLEQSSTARLLPTYADDFDGDEDDRKAMGKTDVEYAPVEEEDLEEADEELEAFNALEVGERLQRVVEYLRRAFHYCFWCKYHYPDVEMEGCPGATEEDHD